MSPASAQTTITGTVKDASGTALASGTIIFTLSQEGTVSDPALLVVRPVVTCTITNGVIGTCSLRGNDEISPAGTFYRVRIISTGGRTFLPERTYTITGATWDIGTQTPLASDTIAAQAYQIVQDEGANLAQRQKLNFTGAGVSVADDSGNAVTKVTITGSGSATFTDLTDTPGSYAGQGGLCVAVKSTVDGLEFVSCGAGGGATHQIDAVGLTSQDPINFLDTSEFDWTNPAAGNLSLALKAASVADSKLASNYSGVGSCAANNFVTGVNDNAAPTCAQPGFSDLSGSATDAQVPDSITLTNITQITNRAITDLSGTAGRSQLPAQVVYDDEANTYGAFKQDFGAATVEVPNAITLPGTCTVGEVFHDTDAAVGARFYLCTALNTWTAFDNPFGTAVDIGEVSFDPILETELDTISELNTQITDATIEVQANKNAASGYAGLTAGTKLQLSQGQEVWAIADLSDVTAKSGNTTVVGTTSGALGAGNCAQFDASGNIVDSGAGCGGGAGDNISVNGTAAVDADFDDATPAAPANSVNVRFQKDSGTPNNISANLLLTDIDGNGIGVSSTELIVDLLTADDQVGSSSNQSGLEFGGAGSDKLGLLRACTNGQILKFNTTGGLWECQNDNTAGGNVDLLDGSVHQDTAAGTVARGDIITGQTATPLWTRLALGGTNLYPKSDGTDIVYSTLAAGGVGTCTNQFVTALNADATPTCTTATLASAQFANQGTTTTVLHGNAAGNPSFGAIVGADITDGTINSAELATANKTFKCNFVLFRDTGLKDSDDINSISNCSRPGRAITITEVHCETDAGSPVVNLQRDDGTPANILSSNLTCTTGGANGTIAGAEDNIAATDKIDFVAVSGMSGANRISVLMEYTVD